MDFKTIRKSRVSFERGKYYPALEELIEEFHGQFNLLYFAVGVGWGARTFSGIETNTREQNFLWDL